MQIPPLNLENTIPILCVADMQASRAFYVGILGFKEVDWGTNEFTCVNRDAGGIYLCHNGQGNPGTWVWFGFDGDIYAWHDYLKEKGVTILQPPANHRWAMEMLVQDRDGHVLRFGKEPDEKLPFV